MTHALHDPIRHNAWATTQLLAFCQGLDEQTLNATVPGTYGTIMATLRHIIYCEIDLLERLLGQEPTYPWRLGETTGLDVLTAQAAQLATDWESFLAGVVDSERPLPPEPYPGRDRHRRGALPRQRASRADLHHPRRARPRAVRPHTLGLRICQWADMRVGV